MSTGMVQHTARRIDYLVGAAQVLARSEYVGSVSAERSQRGPGETGTGGGCGTTSELLGLRIGAGGTYGAGGSCADAIPTDKETVASENSKRVRKTCSDPYVYYYTMLCGKTAPPHDAYFHHAVVT